MTRDREGVAGRSAPPASKSDPDRLAATLMLQAMKDAYGSRARLENLYLQDGQVAAIEQTAAKYAKRVTNCETAIADICRGGSTRWRTTSTARAAPSCS